MLGEISITDYCFSIFCVLEFFDLDWCAIIFCSRTFEHFGFISNHLSQCEGSSAGFLSYQAMILSESRHVKSFEDDHSLTVTLFRYVLWITSSVSCLSFDSFILAESGKVFTSIFHERSEFCLQMFMPARALVENHRTSYWPENKTEYRLNQYFPKETPTLVLRVWRFVSSGSLSALLIVTAHSARFQSCSSFSCGRFPENGLTQQQYSNMMLMEQSNLK